MNCDPILPQSAEAAEPSDAESRFVRLETMISELEHMVEQLNGAVVEQGKALRRMQAQQLQVAATMETLELERIRATNSKPPHSVI